MMKLDDISKENDPILDELSFFLFNEKIKLILDNEPNQILNQKTYLLPYFEHNIELLQPEIIRATNATLKRKCLFIVLYFYVTNVEKIGNFSIMSQK